MRPDKTATAEVEVNRASIFVRSAQTTQTYKTSGHFSTTP